MADHSAIEWTDTTWNPTTGCDKVSPGCDHCYALTLAKRLKGMGSAKYQTDGDPKTSGPGFGLAMHPDALNLPLSWRKPRRVFVNSMSDLFHDRVSDQFIAEAWAVMALAERHAFQVLTKRPARMRALLSTEDFKHAVGVAMVHRSITADESTRRPIVAWPLPNVWCGVSVEDQKWADIRIPALLDTPAAVRWVSAEPLLRPVDLRWCAGIDALEPDWIGGPGGGSGAPHPLLDWVVTGGESGPDFRPADPAWFRQIRDQCLAAGVAYLHKQNGGRTPKSNGRLIDGWTWDQYPTTVAHHQPAEGETR